MAHHHRSTSNHRCSSPSVDSMPTMPPPSSPETPLDCFAEAIKLITLAAVIDQRITELVPVFAESFVTVSRSPKARSPLSMNLLAQEFADFPQGTESHIVLLHKIIRVLSVCTADCPHEVSRLIPLVTLHMIPMQQVPESFPSTIVEGEHQSCSSGNSDSNKAVTSTLVSLKGPLVHSGKDLLSSGQSSSQEPTKLPALSSRSTIQGSSKKKKSSTAPVSSVIPHPSSSDVVDLLSPPHSPRQECNEEMNKSESLKKTSMLSSVTSKLRSNQGAERSYKNNGSSAASSPSSSLHSLSDSSLQSNASSKRRNREEEISSMNFGRIPKKVKSHGSIAPDVPNKNQSYGIKSTLTYELVLRRFEAWKKFLSYSPSKKCVPSDTFLAIIITSPSESEVLKAFKSEASSNADVAAYLSVTKIYLIPRILSIHTGTVMSYSISNLHKYLHGSLHINSEQDDFFKEASAHLEVKVLEVGEPFDDPHNGIHIKYDDPNYGFSGIHQLAGYVAPFIDSSCSTSRMVPNLSIGWSTANAHLYKHNRTNMVGSISPFLIKQSGIEGLPMKEKCTIVSIVCNAVRYFSHCGRTPTPFYHSDPNMRVERSKLAKDFLESLVGAEIAKHWEKDFLAEGVSFIFNNFVSFHKDTMNDPTPGMNVTLSANCNLTITEELAGVKAVKKAMKMFSLEVGDPLSFSVMIYSRKIIRDFIKRKNKISSMMDYPLGGVGNVKALIYEPNWIISPLLKAIHRVNSDVNTNSAWDNPSDCMRQYKEKVQREASNPQYNGEYVSLVAGFDKMRYWSPVKYLADALHARGLVRMNAESLMGYICFASLETNGTFLLAGIIDDAMCTQDPRNCPFIREVEMFGMYAALIFAAHRKNKNIGTGTVYGSSKVPRHQHHNRGSTDRFPIAGGKGLLSFEGGDKLKIVERCRSVVSKMIDMCQDAVTEMQGYRNNKKRGTGIQSVARSVYEEVQDLSGPGIGHIFAMNFIQVASMFGFLPGELATWACVDSKTSGAYKAINTLYHQEVEVITKKTGFMISRWKEDISVEDAEKCFSSAVKWLNQNVSYNCTAALLENILCELNRETGSLCPTKEQWAPSPKKDVLYFFKHRKGTMHHLYRWKTDVKGVVTQQVLLVPCTGDDVVIKSLTHLSIKGRKDKEGEDMSALAHWSGDPLGVQPVDVKSEYILSPEYCKYFM